MQAQLEAGMARLAEMQEQGKLMMKEEVDGEDIAEIVSKWTGIPVTRMLQSEREKLVHLEDELKKKSGRSG